MFLKHSNVAVSIRIDKAQSKLVAISVSDFWFLHAMLVSSVRGEKRYGDLYMESSSLINRATIEGRSA